jgi:hypothetical protein
MQNVIKQKVELLYETLDQKALLKNRIKKLVEYESNIDVDINACMGK